MSGWEIFGDVCTVIMGTLFFALWIAIPCAMIDQHKEKKNGKTRV